MAILKANKWERFYNLLNFKKHKLVCFIRTLIINTHTKNKTPEINSGKAKETEWLFYLLYLFSTMQYGLNNISSLTS